MSLQDDARLVLDAQVNRTDHVRWCEVNNAVWQAAQRLARAVVDGDLHPVSEVDYGPPYRIKTTHPGPDQVSIFTEPEQ